MSKTQCEIPIDLISEAKKERAEEEITTQQRISDYDVREYPIEVIVDKFTTKLEDGFAELYIPDYQRDYVWLARQESRFIESLLINLPIPYIFVADSSEEEMEGRLEIIDGSQRIRAVTRFVHNKFQLEDLEKLPALNGFRFKDLKPARQRRFLRRTIRMIELTELADEETRRDMFDRLNSGGTRLKYMEVVRGTRKGPFMDLVHELAELKKFKTSCPITEAKAKNREAEELILRYFAYANSYEKFDHRVDDFLNAYLDEVIEATTEGSNNYSPELLGNLRNEFIDMLDYVEKHFPYGFKKKDGHNSVPRLRFECISVGSTLALRENPHHIPPATAEWLDSEDFKFHTRTDASNSRPRVFSRLNFVKDKLLGNEPIPYGDTTEDVD